MLNKLLLQHKKNYFKLLLMMFILTKTTAFSQTKHEIGFQTDNDSYLGGGSDRYYTNGISFYYRRTLETKPAQDPALVKKIYEIEAGQKMYTPQSASINSPKDIDRPFAGVLYVSSHLNFVYLNERNLRLSGQVGVIGKASGAQQMQTFLHKKLGLYMPNGWQYQIHNHVTVNFSAEYNRLLLRRSFFDVILDTRVDLGNRLTRAALGTTLRIGRLNQLFNSVTTKTKPDVHKHIELKAYEIYFYYTPKLYFIGYEATIQGNLFSTKNFDRPQITSTIEPFVISHQIGMDYSNKYFTVGIAATIKTKETKTMIKHRHQWGTITFSYLF